MMPHPDAGVRPPPEGPELLVQACRSQGIRDERLLDAFRRVRREDFVPPQWVGEAYRDRPIPIPHGQVTTQPSLVAHMVAALRLRGEERVLEIGTGLGFQTAILATLAAQVFSIERFADLAARAERNLRSAGIEDVKVAVGDGTLGLPADAPFDAMVVSAAAPQVPAPLLEQLAGGGRLVHPVGFGGDEVVTAYRKHGDRLVPEAELIPAHFVRLVGAHGLPEEPEGSPHSRSGGRRRRSVP
jgi:protein-L-isoaspartate(D-aspartate) O-methyltransferase